MTTVKHLVIEIRKDSNYIIGFSATVLGVFDDREKAYDYAFGDIAEHFEVVDYIDKEE
jgi:hypothetical protein